MTKGGCPDITGALPVQKPQGRSQQCKFQEERKDIQRTNYTYLLRATANKDLCTKLSEALGGYLLSVTGITARRVQETLGRDDTPLPTVLMGILGPTPWLWSREVV